jgi:aryl-alcohol dehydrogenase-like predicted oxidoreductase
MEYRQLGSSGLRVSTLSLGTMTFGGQGKFAKTGDTDLQSARRQIAICIEAGVNLFDTADVYSAGMAEEILGQALGERRQRVLIASKARFSMGDGQNDRGSSRHHLLNACHASLQRLKTDYIDLYQLHEWDGLTPLEETLRAMDDLVQSGKVRYIGISNFTAWQLMKTLGVAASNHWIKPVSQQIHYSLQAREAEYELLPISQDQGVGVLVWSPLAGGLLSGKYRRDQAAPSGTRHFAEWGEPPIRDEKLLFDIIDVLIGIARDKNVAVSQVALAWLLTRKQVSSVIIGARNEQQLRENLGAATLQLTQEELSALQRVSQLPLLYPYWHQARTAAGRLSSADMTLLAPYLAP